MSGDVSRRLAPFQRRDTLVRLVQGLALTLPLCGALLLAAVRYGLPAGATGALFVTLSVGGAAAAALAQRRSPRELAAHIDRRHRFHNRVAAALESEPSADVVAALLRRDALQRLATVTPAASLPIETPRRFRHVLAVSALIAIAAFSISSSSAGTTPAAARGNGAGDASATASADTRPATEGDSPRDDPAAVPPAKPTPLARASASAAQGTAADVKTGTPPGRGSSPAAATGAGRGGSGQLSAPNAAAADPQAGAAAGGAATGGLAAPRAGGISRDADALPGDRVARPSVGTRAGARLLTAGQASSSASAAADLPPAMRAYVLRYLESLKR